MNRPLTTLISAMILFTTHATAGIWRIDNNVGAVDADFATLQAAHDDANVLDGDTLYVTGSPTNYGGLTSYKQLFIFGPGYFLDENLLLQASVLRADCGTITFATGAEGSIIAGMNPSMFGISTDSITIIRNYIEGSGHNPTFQIYSGASHITISQNYIINNNSSSGFQYGIIFYGASSDVVIANNYIYIGTDESSVLDVPSSASSFAITNNIFRGNIVIENSSFQNNILRSGTFSGTNVSLFNNLGNSTQFGTANGNLENVDMTSVFVNTGSTDAQWKLATGSAAIGAGIDGVDAGAFGGGTPYILSGIPEIPAIYQLDVPGLGLQSGSMQINIKARGNN